MSSETIKPVVAPEIPPVPEVTARGVGHTINVVAYWSFIGVGVLVPPILGFYGTFF